MRPVRKTREPPRLVGRDDEQRRIEKVTAAALAGRGGALVLKGENGIGKSALLDCAAGTAPGFRILHTSGTEFERDLPFAALHQLCVPLLRRVDEVTDRHRTALKAAFGLAPGTPDPLSIGPAALELITSAALAQPLLCLVDDAQWLDPASSRVLAFLSRRMAADPVALLFASRWPCAIGPLDRLPAHFVGRLSDQDARDLLAARNPLPLDEKVRDRLVAEAQGHPPALLDVPWAGGFRHPPARLDQGRLEQTFQARLAACSEEGRMLLAVASADLTGTPGLLWAAAQQFGLDLVQASSDAASTGLVEFAARVRFCQPLARSTVYQSTDPTLRRKAHAALARVTDPLDAADRRAWHRAQGCDGPDDNAAAELERCAPIAQRRGGVAAAAAFLDRAAALTLDSDRRYGRALAAVQAHLAAGDTETGADLLATVGTAGLDDHRRARVEELQGRIAFTRSDHTAGLAAMITAARRLSADDPARAGDCLLDALEYSLRADPSGSVISDITAAVRRNAPVPPSSSLLAALITLATDGYPVAAPKLRSALDIDQERLWGRWPALAGMIAAELWDQQTHAAIARWLIKAGRDAGAPALLRLGLAQTAVGSLLAGEIGQALAATAEEEAIADAVGAVPVRYHRLHLAAHRGHRDDFHEIAGSAADIDVHWTLAMLHNGYGNHAAAFASARPVLQHGDGFLTGAALVELAEAAVHCDEPGIAARALETLTARTRASGTTSGLAVGAYARGLVTGVEDHYREAIERLGETNLVFYRARAHLVYGEWLRDRGRREDCLHHLRVAHATLSRSGAAAFAHRAALELHAIGEKVAQRQLDQLSGKLTVHELAVARLVTTGATSKQVADQLFVSKRTVDAHLRNIFRKLGVRSRMQLQNHPDLSSRD